MRTPLKAIDIVTFFSHPPCLLRAPLFPPALQGKVTLLWVMKAKCVGVQTRQQVALSNRWHARVNKSPSERGGGDWQSIVVIFLNVFDVSIYKTCILFTKFNPKWEQFFFLYKRVLYIDSCRDFLIKPRILQGSAHINTNKVKQSRYRPGVAQRVPGS